jgi:hypothetical protein
MNPSSSSRTKLYCVITPSHEILYNRFFLPSVDTTHFELKPHFLDQEGTGELLAEDFKRCIQFKLQKIIDSIQESLGEIIVWSDVDIQFLGLRPSHLFKYFDPDIDFAIQRLSQNGEVLCGGFYAIRCSQRMVNFFSEVVELTVNETNGNEQEAINRLLKKKDCPLRWKSLGREFYARIHGIFIPSNTVLHHATDVRLDLKNRIEGKAFLLAELEDFNHWNIIRKKWFILLKVPGRIFNKSKIIFNR